MQWRQGSVDELAALGLDPAARRPEDPAMQAKGDFERRLPRVLRTELYSLSNWYKFPVRPPILKAARVNSTLVGTLKFV